MRPWAHRRKEIDDIITCEPDAAVPLLLRLHKMLTTRQGAGAHELEYADELAEQGYDLHDARQHSVGAVPIHPLSQVPPALPCQCQNIPEHLISGSRAHLNPIVDLV